MLTFKLYSAGGAFLRSVEVDKREFTYCIQKARLDRHVAVLFVYNGKKRVARINVE